MTQTQGQSAGADETTLAFQRYILEETSDFEAEPMADLYRVNLLAQMLDRRDELRKRGIGEVNCIERVKYEFSDLARRMRNEGFETVRHGERKTASLWPEFSEDEVAEYITQSNAYLHRKNLGVAECVACVTPLMLACAASELMWGLEDMFMMSGLLGMFGMIGIGIYTILTATPPENRKQIKNGYFSLNARLKSKLKKLLYATKEKSRRRRAKGIALLAACAAPIFAFSILGAIFGGYSDFAPILGVAGMFVMIAAGVYEVSVGSEEEKVIQGLVQENKRK